MAQCAKHLPYKHEGPEFKSLEPSEELPAVSLSVTPVLLQQNKRQAEIWDPWELGRYNGDPISNKVEGRLGQLPQGSYDLHTYGHTHTNCTQSHTYTDTCKRKHS